MGLTSLFLDIFLDFFTPEKFSNWGGQRDIKRHKSHILYSGNKEITDKILLTALENTKPSVETQKYLRKNPMID